jgi:hypothetical protein
MTYPIEQGIQVSIDGGTTWFKITDHNRKEIQYAFEVIEKSARMADGTMRKFVIKKKEVISTSWEFVPSKSSLTVDNAKSSEWLTAFYNTYAFVPIKLKIISAKETDPARGSLPNESTRVTSKTGSKIYDVFITKFTKVVSKRTTATDFVNMDIEFTEI